MCRKFAKILFCAVRVFIGYFCCCLFFANSFNLLILLKNKMLENDIKRVTNSTKNYFLNLPHNPKVVGSNPTPATIEKPLFYRGFLMLAYNCQNFEKCLLLRICYEFLQIYIKNAVFYRMLSHSAFCNFFVKQYKIKL